MEESNFICPECEAEFTITHDDDLTPEVCPFCAHSLDEQEIWEEGEMEPYDSE